MNKKTYVYIGGGAAGYFAAINSAEKNTSVQHILLEGTQRPMMKIKISGGGRCNVTHHCFEANELIKNYPRGSKELLGAFARFQPRDTISWFEQRGVPLKVEDDGRMFPTTDKSESIISCLNREIERLHVQVRKGCLVKTIEKKDTQFILTLQNGETLLADKVLIATGSFPSSYALASSLGHTIVPPVPSLFTFNSAHPLLKEMMGTSFKSVNLDLEISTSSKKKIAKQRGPLLITHWGLSGPAVLKLSAFAARELHEKNYQAQLKIDWTGRGGVDVILEELMDYKNKEPRKTLSSVPHFDMSKRFWQHIVHHALGSKGEYTYSELSKKDLRQLANRLGACEIPVEGKGVFKEEFVSCGGVDLKEVDFKRMESKICAGLFFAGEVLNIDGITGGFNFQNAWTTGWIVSQNI
jgi:predicted Rossmann fold flavoprotein